LRGSPAELVHVPTPAAAQSASLVQDTLEFPEHPPQAHFFPGAPLQLGLAAESVRLAAVLLLASLMLSNEMTVPGFGGQSRLVAPNSATEVVPLASHKPPL
jgi:hypothetical protein